MRRQIEFNASAVIQIVIAVIWVFTVLMWGADAVAVAHAEIVIAIAVAVIIVAIDGAARRLQLWAVLILAIALKGFAIGQWGALRFGNARCGALRENELVSGYLWIVYVLHLQLTCAWRRTAGRWAAVAGNCFGIEKIISCGFNGRIVVGQLNAWHGRHSAKALKLQRNAKGRKLLKLSANRSIGQLIEVRHATKEATKLQPIAIRTLFTESRKNMT